MGVVVWWLCVLCVVVVVWVLCGVWLFDVLCVSDDV